METIARKKLLKIYQLHSQWAVAFEFACRKGCSTCCTRSVSTTTLEAELIHEHIGSEKPELLPLLDILPDSALNQKTTNQFAASCLREEMTEEEEHWDMSPCVFLHDGCCLIYHARPFICRSFGSRIICNRTGSAEIDPLYLTLNTVILQCIEHLDRGRPWGNMNTILKMVAGQNAPAVQQQKTNYRIAEPIPGLLIPPDEQQQLQEQLHTLQRILSER